MGYKSDREFRDDLWQNVTRGLPPDLRRKAHEYLGKHYQEKK